MTDVEADGPCPGLFSMTEIGIVKVEEPLIEAPTFYAKLRPLEGAGFIQEALDVCNRTREETLAFPDAEEGITAMAWWVKENNTSGRPQFISDNNGFDYQFVNYYCWKILGYNPFGHSSTNLGSLYKGIKGDFFQSFKWLRKTTHDHNPVNDSMGNCEALIAMRERYGLKMKLK